MMAASMGGRTKIDLPVACPPGIRAATAQPRPRRSTFAPQSLRLCPRLCTRPRHIEFKRMSDAQLRASVERHVGSSITSSLRTKTTTATTWCHPQQGPPVCLAEMMSAPSCSHRCSFSHRRQRVLANRARRTSVDTWTRTVGACCTLGGRATWPSPTSHTHARIVLSARSPGTQSLTAPTVFAMCVMLQPPAARGGQSIAVQHTSSHVGGRCASSGRRLAHPCLLQQTGLCHVLALPPPVVQAAAHRRQFGRVSAL